MKKLITLLLIAAMTITIAGCAEQEIDPNAENEEFKPIALEDAPLDEHGRRDTPIRIAENGTLYLSPSKTFTLDIATEDAYIIADITIVEWLGEPKDGGQTFFRAKVNKTLKGKVYEEIEIIQLGSSETTSRSFPLLKNGNRLLAFLHEPLTGEDLEEYANKHHLNSFAMLDILEHEGQPYFLNRGRTLDQDLLDNDDIEKIEGELRTRINAEFAKDDPVLARASESARIAGETGIYPSIEEENERKSVPVVNRIIFNYDDVVNVIMKMVESGERG